MSTEDNEEKTPAYGYSPSEISVVVGRLWGAIQPTSLFTNAYIYIVMRGQDYHVEHVALSRLTHFHNRLENEEDRRYVDWLMWHLERHIGFIAFKRELDRFGLEGSRSGTDYNYSNLYTWSIIVREHNLEGLERAAQDFLGFDTPSDRAKAAEDFRIYMQRHYSPDYEKNRQSLPAVDHSPYWPVLDAKYTVNYSNPRGAWI